jgi:hypothetical protein
MCVWWEVFCRLVHFQLLSQPGMTHDARSHGGWWMVDGCSHFLGVSSFRDVKETGDD